MVDYKKIISVLMCVYFMLIQYISSMEVLAILKLITYHFQ